MHSNLDFSGNTENSEKTRQNAENKQTIDLTRKIEIQGKTRQNTEMNKLLTWVEKLTLNFLIYPIWSIENPCLSNPTFL